MVVWLLTLPLAIAGSQVAHALAYRLVVPGAHKREQELAAAGHGYYAYLPLMLAIGTVLVACALAVEVRHIAKAEASLRPRARPFAMLAPAIFCCQEYFERLIHDGAIPWETALSPTFGVGLLLQFPFAVAAYLLARTLLRAARVLGVLLARYRARRCGAVVLPPTFVHTGPRVPALALGYGSRGPPHSFVVS
jgi:hypothetical protein